MLLQYGSAALNISHLKCFLFSCKVRSWEMSWCHVGKQGGKHGASRPGCAAHVNLFYTPVSTSSTEKTCSRMLKSGRNMAKHPHVTKPNIATATWQNHFSGLGTSRPDLVCCHNPDQSKTRNWKGWKMQQSIILSWSGPNETTYRCDTTLTSLFFFLFIQYASKWPNSRQHIW